VLLRLQLLLPLQLVNTVQRLLLQNLQGVVHLLHHSAQQLLLLLKLPTGGLQQPLLVLKVLQKPMNWFLLT
jgi:hypothetical protein